MQWYRALRVSYFSKRSLKSLKKLLKYFAWEIDSSTDSLWDIQWYRVRGDGDDYRAMQNGIALLMKVRIGLDEKEPGMQTWLVKVSGISTNGILLIGVLIITHDLLSV